jgi:DNA-binding response OmpR family regulator
MFAERSFFYARWNRGGEFMAMLAVDTGLFTASAFPRILTINDEPEMRTMLEHGLGNLGFEVRVVSNVRVLAEAVQGWMPEAIVLDADLSSVDAFSLVASLRRITDVPILMLSGSSESEHRVRALTRGADDYIAAPFDWDEVAAYIRARLRRPRMEKRDVITYADVTIDVTRRKAARGSKPLDLSTREFDLLFTLACHPEQVFTRSQLLDLVWGMDRAVAPATVETYISYLRAKVDVEGGDPLIHTLRGVGYTMRVRAQ